MSKINFKVKGFRMLGFPVLLLLIVGIEILSFGNQTEAAFESKPGKEGIFFLLQKEFNGKKISGSI